MLLEVSFTPAKDREAEKIVSAIKRRPTLLRVTKTGREMQALRLGSGSMLVSVDSVEEAQAVLEDLCFKKTDLVFPQKEEPNQPSEPTRGTGP